MFTNTSLKKSVERFKVQHVGEEFLSLSKKKRVSGTILLLGRRGSKGKKRKKKKRKGNN
jgi:hypothetical protein